MPFGGYLGVPFALPSGYFGSPTGFALPYTWGVPFWAW